MKKIILLIFIALSFSVAFAETYTILKEGPFANIDLSKLKKEDAKILQEANSDFIRVVKGQKPSYAKIDKSAPLPADGGTTFYKGQKYNLTILKSISIFGDLNGYVYGPIIIFDESFASGNTREISSLKFYETEDMKKLIR